jgi:hypothetical protein
MNNFKCHNPNIGFAIKCEVQGSIRPKMCLGVKHTLTNGAKDEAQWLPNALPLWELNLCKSCECLEPWLEKKKTPIWAPMTSLQRS